LTFYQHYSSVAYTAVFLFRVALSDLNVIIYRSTCRSRADNFCRSTGRFNRRVIGRVGSRKSRPVRSLISTGAVYQKTERKRRSTVCLNSIKRPACWRVDKQRGVTETLGGVRHRWMATSSRIRFATERWTHQTYR